MSLFLVMPWEEGISGPYRLTYEVVDRFADCVGIDVTRDVLLGLRVMESAAKEYWRGKT